jgi:hypothetical protein
MLKKFAFIIAVVITGLGIFFIGLNILDIDEGYRLYLPVAILNTVLIAAVAMLVAYLAARSFATTGSPEMLGLGGAVLAFGVGILIYGWFTRAVLEVRFAVYDGTFLMAAVMHFYGIILMKSKLSMSGLKLRQKQAIVLLLYLLICVIIAVPTWLLYRVLPSFTVPRDLFHLTGAVLCIAAAVIYFKIYRKSHLAFYYWYSLGLMLFTLGILFMSQGPLESRVAWLGRAGQYIGSIYFLVAVLGAHKRARKPEVQ